MNTEKAKALLERYKNGTLTAEEKAILDAWYVQLASEAEINVAESSILHKKDELWERIQNDIPAPAPVRALPRSYKWAVAAAVLLCAGSIFWYTRNQAPATHTTKNQVAVNDIAPGSNKAVLTLGNGEKITLTDATAGRIANDGGAEITRAAAGQLVYHHQTSTPRVTYNTITIPHGGQYALTLADGTTVVLNAGSSLTYPTAFTGPDRRVTLRGEGYFEVSKDKNHPFIVKTDKQEIEVLGTHFNLNAYADDPAVKTTLLEGAVKVTAGKQAKILKPGDQSVLQDNDLTVKQVDTETAVAWKNGLFIFEDEPLKEIMRKISRWYDVEIIYQEVDSDKRFGGSAPRYSNVSKLLKRLESTGGIHFKIEGRRIIVMN